MPNVLEVEETLSEIQELPIYEKPRQAIAPRPGFVRRITAAFKGMAVRGERSPEFRECRASHEMPLETLARKYPYMYADALLG